jgi:pyrimidine-nucleoside phosphorylase
MLRWFGLSQLEAREAMRTVDIITKKRDGGELTREEIDAFIQGYVAGDIPDYQAAAWAMAVYFRGMTPAETARLTEAMAFSGETLDLHDTLPFIVDKHSSGGVGDKTTLVVGPMVATLGVPVGKMSGRGLSFSGGTLDKLEAIPGFSVRLTLEQFKRQLKEIGLVVAGQTKELAPADGKLYALRDVTGTVPSLPLIASSIMSKKIAAGADAIVLDVKVGQGAFMETVHAARELAELMVAIGRHLGRTMTALIGDMSQPLGLAVGNALEVQEAIHTLHGKGPEDFRSHCIDVAREMLLIAGKATDADAAAEAAAKTLTDGSAWAKFREFVEAQGGDVSYVDYPERLPGANVVVTLRAPADGYIHRVDAREVGYTVVDLGGGRARKEDAVDPSVGVLLSPVTKIGQQVRSGQPLLEIHGASRVSCMPALARLSAAITISPEPIAAPPLIHSVIR